jgi:hypothetical protein
MLMSISREPLQHYRESALALLVRHDFGRVHKLVADSGLSVLTGWASDAYINALMGLDIRAAREQALAIADSARRDNLMRSISERQSGAGYLDDAAHTAALIRSSTQRLTAELQIAQQRTNHGDTTGVRATVLRAMQDPDLRATQHELSYRLVPTAMIAGMTEELLAWSESLPSAQRVYVLTGMLTQLPR